MTPAQKIKAKLLPPLCIYCKQFDIEEAYREGGYSEYTPSYGVNAKIRCKKGYWQIDCETENVNNYRKYIETASQCKDYEFFNDN